jgi:hypothetical protein
MFSTNEPNQPGEYGNYISQMIKETTDSCLVPYDLATQASRLQDLVHRVRKECVRISNMRDGQRAALTVLLDLKMTVLPIGGEQHSVGTYVRGQAETDQALGIILQRAETIAQTEFLDLTRACRRLRSCMFGNYYPTGICPIVHPNNNACQHNLLLPALDLLQRHAYYEILAIVRLAVDNRLPPELTDSIFQQTLTIEGIPEDPRVLVRAYHIEDEDIGEQDRRFTYKCLYPCPHEFLRAGEGYLAPSSCGIGYRYVMEDEFVAYPPRIPRNTTTASDLRAAEWVTGAPSSAAYSEESILGSDALAVLVVKEQEEEARSFLATI